jgi:hypothetical protein
MTDVIERHDEAGAVDGAAESAVSIVLWTRRPVCGPRTDVIDRLAALSTAGHLSGFAVETWPEEVVVSEPGRHEALLDRIDRFEQWAADNGLSVRPPFQTRTKSPLVGRSETVLKTPMLFAAAYEGDTLVGVYPCSDGEQTWTVPEYLDAIERRDEQPHDTGERPVPAVGDGR